jgi:hypothetical protein
MLGVASFYLFVGGEWSRVWWEYFYQAKKKALIEWLPADRHQEFLHQTTLAILTWCAALIVVLSLSAYLLTRQRKMASDPSQMITLKGLSPTKKFSILLLLTLFGSGLLFFPLSTAHLMASVLGYSSTSTGVVLKKTEVRRISRNKIIRRELEVAALAPGAGADSTAIEVTRPYFERISEGEHVPLRVNVFGAQLAEDHQAWMTTQSMFVAWGIWLLLAAALHAWSWIDLRFRKARA